MVRHRRTSRRPPCRHARNENARPWTAAGAAGGDGRAVLRAAEAARLAPRPGRRGRRAEAEPSFRAVAAGASRPTRRQPTSQTRGSISARLSSQVSYFRVEGRTSSRLDRQAGNGLSRGAAKESGAPLAGLPKKAVPEAAAARAVPGCRSVRRRGKSRRHGRSRVRSGPGP